MSFRLQFITASRVVPLSSAFDGGEKSAYHEERRGRGHHDGFVAHGTRQTTGRVELLGSHFKELRGLFFSRELRSYQLFLFSCRLGGNY